MNAKTSAEQIGGREMRIKVPAFRAAQPQENPASNPPRAGTHLPELRRGEPEISDGYFASDDERDFFQVQADLRDEYASELLPENDGFPTDSREVSAYQQFGVEALHAARLAAQEFEALRSGPFCGQLGAGPPRSLTAFLAAHPGVMEATGNLSVRRRG